MYAPSDGACRRRDWMTRRARDGGFIARMDPSRARAWCVFVVSRTIRIRLVFWAWFIAKPVNARSLCTRRPMAPVGVEIVWRGAPAMGNCIARMDASRVRVCFSFGVA